MIVVDTHVLVWWLGDRQGLSRKARRLLAEAESERASVVVSAISALEVATAARRGRLALSVSAERWLADVKRLPEIRFEPVTDEIACMAGSFRDSMHGDPADRIIAATAHVLGFPLLTADEKLRSNRDIATLW